MGGMRRFLVSLIPKYVSDRVFLSIYQLLAWIRVPRRTRERNYIENCGRLRGENWSFWDDSSSYIENQEEWRQIRFGKGLHHNMSYSGCEIIASFNALKALTGCSAPEQMAELIRDYEASGAALWGEFGTSPRAIERYFKKNGFTVRSACGRDQAAVEEIGRKYRVMIATVYNDRTDITKQVHTVCITGDSRSGYVLHNAYLVNQNGKYAQSIPYKTLAEAIGRISRYEPKLICLIGVADERKAT